MLTFVVSLAFAQQEACEPQPATAFVALLDQAVPLLESSPRDAGPVLDDAAEVARCLSAPVDRSQLARFAWARAEVAAADQDEEATWSWSTLAIDAGAPTPPERLAKRHPLRIVLQDAPEPPPITGPADVSLAVPKKGSIYADGTPLTVPAVRLDTPHLLQVFEKEGLYLGFWQTGASFPHALLFAPESVRAKPAGDAHDAVPPANWKPLKTGTEEAYKTWITKHPKGPWLQEAKDAIDALHWDAAQKDGSELAYRQYIHDFPDGLHVKQAAFLVEHDAYTVVMERPTRERWVEFLERFDEGTYANEARLQIDTIDWRAAQNANTPSAYAAFMKKHPKGPHARRAQEKEEETTFEKAASVLSDGGLNAYLERWPQGRFVREAQALKGGVEIVDTTLTVTGDLPPPELDVIRAALVAELEKRRLPLVEVVGPQTGELRVDVGSIEDGDFARVLADMELAFGDLGRPLISLSIDSPVLKTADKGATLAEMLPESLPDFDIWHHPPEEKGAAGKPKDEGEKVPLIVQ